MTREIRELTVLFAHACNEKYRQEMNELFTFIDRIDKRLSREIKDLEDIRLVMMAVKDLRENEISYEMKIEPVEESYALLTKYEVHLSREETDRADTLRFRWNELQRRCVSFKNRLNIHSNYMRNYESLFRTSLLEDIRQVSPSNFQL